MKSTHGCIGSYASRFLLTSRRSSLTDLGTRLDCMPTLPSRLLVWCRKASYFAPGRPGIRYVPFLKVWSLWQILHNECLLVFDRHPVTSIWEKWTWWTFPLVLDRSCWRHCHTQYSSRAAQMERVKTKFLSRVHDPVYTAVQECTEYTSPVYHYLCVRS